PNYVTLLILRFIVGFGLGGAHVFTTWFMEFIPTLTRGTWMIAFFVSCSIGTSVEALLPWGIVERFGWRLLLGVSSLPSLCTLLFYKKVAESPRFVYAKGELAKASKILEGGSELNKRPLPGGGIIYANIDESTHNVQPSINTPSAPHLIGEVSRVNESKQNTYVTKKANGKGTSGDGAQNEREVVTSEKDEIKDVTLDVDKTVAGEIQIDEEHHTLKKDDPVDRAGPKVEAIFGILDDGDLRTKKVHGNNAQFGIHWVFYSSDGSTDNYQDYCICNTYAHVRILCCHANLFRRGVGVAIVVGRVGSVVLPWVGEGMISDDGNKTPAMVMFAFKISVCMVCALLLPI
nr:truncated transporter-related protein [Tanacetum cinerariifolium]